ncbi:hypothetical protein KAI46_04515 [bacterium]|nr:hypothetical protein [bacterium]
MKQIRLGIGVKYLLAVVGLIVLVVSISFTKLYQIEKRFILGQLEGQAQLLCQQDVLKTDFLATVSHELRTPLTTIRGGVDYLLQTVTDPEQHTYLALLERNIQGLVEMVNNLIDIARIDLDQVELELEEVDLTDLLQEICIIFTVSSEGRGVVVKGRGELPEVTLIADYRRPKSGFYESCSQCG